MTDKHSDRLNPETAPGPRHQSEPATRTESRLLALGEVAADNLIRMTTTAGATIIDLDADPTMRATALILGRDYLAVDLTTLDTPPTRPADLVVLRWPRPGDRSWLGAADEVFAAVRALLSPTGRAAVLLDPTPAHAVGITWTDHVLVAAAAAGMPVLEGLVCLHDMEAHGEGQVGSPALVTLRHRVILVLASRGGRHAQ